MSVSTRTYTSLLGTAEAKFGSSFNPTTKRRFDALIYSAANNANDAYNVWECQIVFAEPRSIARGYIDFTEDSYSLYGAGTDAVNGLYVRNGVNNALPSYVLYASDGTTELYDLIWDGATDWQIVDSTTAAILYDITSADVTPPLTGWAVGTGIALSPKLIDITEMGTVMDININGKPYGNYWAVNKKYVVDSNGILLLGDLNGATVAFVTYKRSHTDIYGDGTAGTVSAIPSEWAEYMARYAARDLQLGAKIAGDNAAVVIGSREVDRALEDAIWRAESQNPEESISRRVTTYLSQNTTL